MEVFSEEAVISYIQNSSTVQCRRQLQWLPPREIPSSGESTIYSTGMHIVIKNAGNAWQLEPDM